MISPAKAAALRALLGQVSGPMAVRLAEAVETDRLAGGASLPHALILESLAPALHRDDDAMQVFTERASQEIWAALPVQDAGAFAGGPVVPDLSRAPDTQTGARALVRARMIDCDDETANALRNYNENLVRELRTAEGKRRANAERYLDIALDLTCILLSGSEGDSLRRRAHAAASIGATA